MKKKAGVKDCIVVDFIKNNRFVFLSGVGALLYCCICAYFKASPVYNISVKLQPWGDLLYNISISIIAAVVFYIAQVYIPDRNRNRVLRRVMQRFCKNVLLYECNALKVRVESVRSGLTSEAEIIAAMDANCQRVHSALNTALENYLAELPVNLIEAISDFLSDDMLYAITKRASGALRNRSLEKIVGDDIQYNSFMKRIEIIKTAVEKM